MSTSSGSSALSQSEALDEQDENCIHDSNDATNGSERESTVSLQPDPAIRQGKTEVDNRKDRDIQARAIKQKLRTMCEENSLASVADQIIREYFAYEDERNEKYK